MTARAMKDSGVSWIGEIPAGWEVVRLGRVLRKLEQGWSPQCLDRPAEKGEWGVLKAGCVNTGVLDPAENKALPSDLGPIPGLAVKRGDVLMNRASGSADHLGAVGVVAIEVERLMLCDKVYRFTMREVAATPSWIVAVLRSAVGRGQISNVAMGQSTLKNISQSEVRRIFIPLPPLDEQRRIADFLDERTAAIDAALAEQESTARLLAERRRTLVSHAVTRGLDPSAPMRDSGVAWIGEVPAQWRLTPLKQVIESIEQGWSPQCEGYPAEGNAWGVLKAGCVNGGVFDPDENKVLPAELTVPIELRVKDGDLLMSRANTRELVGSAAIVETRGRRLLLCDKLYRIVPRPGLLSAYAAAVLGAPFARGHIEAAASGASASMVNISQEVVRELRVPLPPLDEQRRIVDHLRARTAEIDAASEAAARAATLLREVRQSLISAAVTGRVAPE